MRGDEGATIPEKHWWAIDEAKARLDTENVGFQYDRELLRIDENDNIQLLIFGQLAKDEMDILPGHIWIARDVLEVQNMKFLCPKVQGNMIKESQDLINKYQAFAAQNSGDMEAVKNSRAEKDKIKEELEKIFGMQQPLKWVNRLIMWCADKMPSFGLKYEGANANEVVEKALAADAETSAAQEARAKLIEKYLN